MQVHRNLSKIDKIFIEYVLKREDYYRKKLCINSPLKDIIQESMMREDLPILKCLIIQEFPQHRDFLFKHLIIQ